MNERIAQLARDAGLISAFNAAPNRPDIEKFAELMIYDFLNELTNDDSLGEARIDTIKRLAGKWGVTNERTN